MLQLRFYFDWLYQGLSLPGKIVIDDTFFEFSACRVNGMHISVVKDNELPAQVIASIYQVQTRKGPVPKRYFGRPRRFLRVSTTNLTTKETITHFLVQNDNYQRQRSDQESRHAKTKHPVLLNKVYPALDSILCVRRIVGQGLAYRLHDEALLQTHTDARVGIVVIPQYIWHAHRTKAVATPPAAAAGAAPP